MSRIKLKKKHIQPEIPQKDNLIEEKEVDTKSLYTRDQVAGDVEDDVWSSWIWTLNKVNPFEASYFEKVNHVNQLLDGTDRGRGSRGREGIIGKEGEVPQSLGAKAIVSRLTSTNPYHKIWSLVHFAQGNICLRKENLPEAVNMYQKAIEHNPRDHRLFVNRALAFEQMGRLELALIDAKRAVTLKTSDPKTLFRLGQVYHSLRLYFDADAAFGDAFKSGHCLDTYRQMVANRVKAILSMGYEESAAKRAAILYDTLLEALEYLDLNKANISNREKFGMSLSNGDPVLQDLKERLEVIRSKWRPINIFQSKGVVIINPSPQVKQDHVKTAFSKYGKIVKIYFAIHAKSKTIQVDFDNCDSPVEAICGLRGSLNSGLCEGKMALSFAFVPQQTRKDRTRICDLLNECYNWRTTGCHLTSKVCKYRHIRVSNGVDWLPVMSQKGPRPGGSKKKQVKQVKQVKQMKKK